MRAGNLNYINKKDIPTQIPVFPLTGALLLPGGQLPLNIFEPRYMAMIEYAMQTDRMIGMIQPRFDVENVDPKDPVLSDVGCIGRITSMQETGDGRYQIVLSGICRFRQIAETSSDYDFRICKIDAFESDFQPDESYNKVNQQALFKTLEDFVSANDMQPDWKAIKEMDMTLLVNSLAMLAPYGPSEKQALLEAENLKARADTLIALTQLDLARYSDQAHNTLQ